MTIIELNNRKYNLITEILHIESALVIEKIEKLIVEETLNKKSPLSFTLDELKHEIGEAEIEVASYSQDEVKTMSWKK